jgi:integrase
MQIIKLKKGIAIRFYDEDGNQVYLSGFKSRKEAEAAAIEYKEKSLHAVDRDITVKEYLVKWYDEYVNISVAERTRQRYFELLDLHVIPKLGHHKLSKLKPAHISSFYIDKVSSGELSPTTVLQIHRIISEAFKHAVLHEYLKYNPCYAVTPPSKAYTEIYIPSDDELREILKLSKDYSCYIAIYICSITGMRLSEIAGLQVEDFDIKNKRLNLRMQYQRVDGVYKLDDLKTRTSKRQIPLIEGTEKPIIEYLKQRQINKMKNRLNWQENNFLLVHEDGSPLQGENISKTFKKIIRKLEMNENYSFKSLRHYHATWLLRNNIHPKVVSERLGHASVKITLDTYSHMIPDLQEKALKGIGIEQIKHFSID